MERSLPQLLLQHLARRGTLWAGDHARIYGHRPLHRVKADLVRMVPSRVPHPEVIVYHLAHAARADLCGRLGRTVDAGLFFYERDLALCRQEPERRFLEGRLRELG
jgi:hypothetical protein